MKQVKNYLSFKNLTLSRNKPVQQSFYRSRLSNFTQQSDNQIVFQSQYSPNPYNSFSTIQNSGFYCNNHKNKLGQYEVQNKQGVFCKKCAATMASQGFKVQKYQNQQSKQNNSMIVNQFQQSKEKSYKLSRIIAPQLSELMNRKNRNVSKSFKQNTIKQEPKQLNKEQKILKEQKIYSEKLQKIQQLICDISIRDIQQFQKYKNIYAGSDQDFEEEQYFLFGKQIKKQNNKKQQMKTSFQKAINKLQLIYEVINKIKNQQKFQIYQHSHNSSSKTNTNSEQFTQPIINNIKVKTQTSSKSYQDLKPKIGKKTNSKFNDSQNSEREIEMSRLSINQKNNYKPLKQNLSVKTQKPKQKGGSKNCQDTPQSLKSKISESRLIIPKNMAVEMFEKINICESINISCENQMDDKEGVASKQNKCQLLVQNNKKMYGQQKVSQKSNEQRQSLKSDNSKSRKSFNRYRTYDESQR